MTEHKANEKRRQAVALGYGKGGEATTVLAQGYGAVAEHIIAAAKRHGIYVHDSAPLVELLMQLNLDEQIPPHLYQLIAELLVWIANIQAQTDSMQRDNDE